MSTQCMLTSWTRAITTVTMLAKKTVKNKWKNKKNKVRHDFGQELEQDQPDAKEIKSSSRPEVKVKKFGPFKLNQDILELLRSGLTLPGKRKKKIKARCSFSKRRSSRRARNAKDSSFQELTSPAVDSTNCSSSKDYFLVIVRLPTGDRLPLKCHLTSTTSELLRWTFNKIEVPGRLAFLFGLACERPPNEYHYLDEEFLLVDALSANSVRLDLWLRFKFCPRTCLETDVLKEDLIRKFAYGQLRNDLLMGYLTINAIDMDELGSLVGTALQADHGNRNESDLIYLEEYLTGELIDWLELMYKRSELEFVAAQKWASLKGHSPKDAQVTFVRKCPQTVLSHSVFLDEEDMSSYALLAVTSKGLELYQRKFDENKYWQTKTLLVLDFDRLDKVAASARYFTACLSEEGLFDESFRTTGLKYKFYCKGNRIK